MTVEEYLNQDQYFSESEGRLVQIATLPYRRAAYSYRKCLIEFGVDLAGTPLEAAFLAYLEPTAAEVREHLQRYGSVCHLFRVTPIRTSAKIKGVAKRAGIPIKTKKTEMARGLGWIEAEVVSQTSVRIKGHPVA